MNIITNFSLDHIRSYNPLIQWQNMYKLKAQNDKFMTTFEFHRLIYNVSIKKTVVFSFVNQILYAHSASLQR